jgi:hypothetical protein
MLFVRCALLLTSSTVYRRRCAAAAAQQQLRGAWRAAGGCDLMVGVS